MKIKFKLADLCHGFQKECITFIQYARNMKFEDRPDYNYLRGLLKKAAKKKGLKFDRKQFDWIVNKEANDKNENIISTSVINKEEKK